MMGFCRKLSALLTSLCRKLSGPLAVECAHAQEGGNMAESDKGQQSPLAGPFGPIGFENWRAAQAGANVESGAEVPLFTDAWITGEISDGLGPYLLLNTISMQPGALHSPSVVLRYWYH